MRGFRLAILLVVCGGRVAAGQTYSSGTVEVPVGTGETVDLAIVVTDSFAITQARVGIRFSHDFDADLDVVLIPPGGTEYVHLMSDVGGSGRGESELIFDGAAPQAIHEAIALCGSFRPEGGLARFREGASLPISSLQPLPSLAALTGRNSAGTWVLRVDDDAPLDGGLIHEWHLELDGADFSRDPTGVLRILPREVRRGGVFVASCDVRPGENPVDRQISVRVDLQDLGLSMMELRDDGQFPDAVARDGRFTGQVLLPSDAPLGAREVTADVRDSLGRTFVATQEVRITRTAPINDACEQAMELAGPFPRVGAPTYLSGAGIDQDAPMTCAGGGPESVRAAVWFCCEIPRAGRYRFSTMFADAGTTVRDTVLAVYRGTCSSLDFAGCNDDGGSIAPGQGPQSGLQSELILDVAPGEFFVEVGLWRALPEPDDVVNLAVVEVAGSCCVGPACQVLPQMVCEAAGGVYGGDGSVCAAVIGYRTAQAAPFEDIAASGARLVLADDGVATESLGFEFPFWGDVHSSVFVSANGVLSFAGPVPEWQDALIPSQLAPNGAIYLLWDDLNPSQGEVFVETRGTPGADLRWIVQFEAVPQYGRSDRNTFQGVLYFDGRVEVRFEDVSVFDANDASVGLENEDGTRGLGLSGSAIQPHTGLAWILELPAPVCEVVPCLWRGDGCVCDYNGDDGVDGDDVIGFFTDWDRGRTCADVDQSDSVDGDDVIAFFQCWDQGGTGSPGC